MVLLKNDGVLPFGPNVKKILVVGPLAESAEVLHGNYAGTASHAVTALEGIRKQFGGAQVSFVAGTNFLRREMRDSDIRTLDRRWKARAERRIFLRATSRVRHRWFGPIRLSICNCLIPMRTRLCSLPA